MSFFYRILNAFKYPMIRNPSDFNRVITYSITLNVLWKTLNRKISVGITSVIILISYYGLLKNHDYTTIINNKKNYSSEEKMLDVEYKLGRNRRYEFCIATE